MNHREVTYLACCFGLPCWHIKLVARSLDLSLL